MNWKRITEKEFYTELTKLAVEHGDRNIKPSPKGDNTYYSVGGKPMLKIFNLKGIDTYFIREEG